MLSQFIQFTEVISKPREQFNKELIPTTTQSISNVRGIDQNFNHDQDNFYIIDQKQPNPFQKFVGLNECGQQMDFLTQNSNLSFRIGLLPKIQQLNKPQQISNSQQEMQIFQEKDLSQYMVKNVNMPKFFVKIFIRNLESYKYIYKMDHYAYQKVKLVADKLNEFSKESKKNYLSLKHLQMLFTESNNGMNVFLNRKAMHLIIRNQSRKQIFENSQVKHILSYAVATKTFALRCFNNLLASRVQSK